MKNEVSKRLEMAAFLLWGAGLAGCILIFLFFGIGNMLLIAALGSFIGTMIFFALAEIINIMEKNRESLARIEDRIAEMSRSKYVD